MIPPRGSTQLLPADHVFVLLRPERRWLVDRVFSSGRPAVEARPSEAEFQLRGETGLAELEEFYGIQVAAPGFGTLDEFLQAKLGDEIALGASVTVGPVTLTVRDMVDGRIETVGLTVAPDDAIAGGLDTDSGGAT
jgi:cell volume regulation protein A